MNHATHARLTPVRALAVLVLPVLRGTIYMLAICVLQLHSCATRKEIA
jgi:hypothetical protein